MISFLDFFTDPVLRAPTIASMFMCLASSLIGVISFVRKQSLLGESLSHASYPGVVLGVLAAALFFPHSDEWLAALILVGAFITSFLGLYVIDFLQKRVRVSSDAALCFVLSVFFGIGILIASRIQFTHTLWYKQIQVFLYGQAATMTDVHVGIYAVLASVIMLTLLVFYRPIQSVSFDPAFSESTGVKIKFFDSITFLLLVLSIVVGIRSVGVVLMSGMLIAPAVAARQWTHRLSLMFVISGALGIISGFLGNYLSLLIPELRLPTGPMILLCASFFCAVSLLFAPETGLVSRYARIAAFKIKCHQENILKAFWKKGLDHRLSFNEIASWETVSVISLRFLLYRLIRQGWIAKIKRDGYELTIDGRKRASQIVRLHRLWEVYLVDYLGQHATKVHRSAEEMEHILTPQFEKELTELLQNPSTDPHSQPIPAREGL